MSFKTKDKEAPELSLQTFSQITRIFKDKQWPIADHFGDDIFNNFCELLTALDEEESKLILNLTEHFLWIPEGEYLKYFAVAFDKFIKTFEFKNINKIYICPVLIAEDFGKSKSSVFLLYLVKAYISSIQKKYEKFAITFFDSPEFLNEECLLKNDYILCLIDDFIGTGETVERAGEYLFTKNVQVENLAIVSLVGMEQGINYLKDNGYNIYVDIICRKGISDNSTFTEDDVSLMEAIEERIKVRDKYKFGYQRSEALVRMSRTPNNTFPIYWLNNKKNKNAPFPR